VIETTTDDSPFLVDSVSEELTARGLTIRRLLHPVIGAVRDEDGRLVAVVPGRDAEHRESFMHFEVDRPLSGEEIADLEARVHRILHDVALVVRDFDPMQDRVRQMMELARRARIRYSEDQVEEVARFLGWLLELNFVLLGYREYELLDTDEGRAIHAVPGSGLGILADVDSSTFAEVTPLTSLPPDIRSRIEDDELLIYSKTQAYSTVHRRARMDYIGVRRVDERGEIVGEARLIGLFTSKAYMEPAARRRCCTTSSSS
jgi:glutamate dehydrogenase